MAPVSLVLSIKIKCLVMFSLPPNISSHLTTNTLILLCASQSTSVASKPYSYFKPVTQQFKITYSMMTTVPYKVQAQRKQATFLVHSPIYRSL